MIVIYIVIHEIVCQNVHARVMLESFDNRRRYIRMHKVRKHLTNSFSDTYLPFLVAKQQSCITKSISLKELSRFLSRQKEGCRKVPWQPSLLVAATFSKICQQCPFVKINH